MMSVNNKYLINQVQKKSELLHFIIVYLLLFYDIRPLVLLTGSFDKHIEINDICNIKPNSVSLYFILIFLILFY